jgi:hypothetical protein
LVKARVHHGFVCLACGAQQERWRTSRGQFMCSLCGYQMSLTAGTVFQGSKCPLYTWFRAMYLIATAWPPPTPRAFQGAVQMPSYSTANLCFTKLLRLIDPPANAPLTGPVEFRDQLIGDRAVLLAVSEGGSGVRYRWTTAPAPTAEVTSFVSAWVAGGSSKVVCDQRRLLADLPGATLEDSRLGLYALNYTVRAIRGQRHQGMSEWSRWRLYLPVWAFRSAVGMQTALWAVFDELLGRAVMPNG